MAILSSLFGLLTVVISALAIYHILLKPRVDLPPQLLNHPSIIVPDIFSAETGNELMTLVKDMKEFPSNANDVKFYKTLREDIGEAQPLDSEGKCPHEYMVPNNNKTQCNLAGRIDIGRHYILAGGVEGKKEIYEDSVSRLLSFGRYVFTPRDYPVIDRLFNSETFQNAALSICPKDKQVLDPFQFNIIIQVPGQTVALHIDGVFFWGATRFEFPQWFLAAMKFSGLFEENYIDQIQVVAYLHQWQPSPERGGDFVYWKQNKDIPLIQAPVPRFGSIIDGAKSVHAATVYYPTRKAPRLDKSAENVLTYLGDDKWQVTSSNKTVSSYTTDDLRISLVYRARCFRNEEEISKFKNRTPEESMALEDILEKFTADLIQKGKLSNGTQYQSLNRLDLALMILDEYVKYPLPALESAVVPYNYCALPKKYPALANLFGLICN